MSMVDVYCIHNLTLKRLVSLDKWNAATWTEIRFKGRWDRGTKLVRNAQGEQVVAAAMVTIPKSVGTVTHADRIIDEDSVEHAIIALESISDFTFSHWEAAVS